MLMFLSTEGKMAFPVAPSRLILAVKTEYKTHWFT